jgi:hypothetical protein
MTGTRKAFGEESYNLSKWLLQITTSKIIWEGILVLVPKGVSDQYHGITLLEVIYKLISTRINHRISEKVEYH